MGLLKILQTLLITRMYEAIWIVFIELFQKMYLIEMKWNQYYFKIFYTLLYRTPEINYNFKVLQEWLSLTYSKVATSSPVHNSTCFYRSILKTVSHILGTNSTIQTWNENFRTNRISIIFYSVKNRENEGRYRNISETRVIFTYISIVIIVNLS